MGDVFIERMIKRKMQQFDFIVLAAVFVALLIVIVLAVVIGTFVFGIPMISLLVITAAIFGGYKLISTRFLEYEYSLTNGFVTVDKIINKAKRKRMTSFECESCEDIGEYKEAEARLRTRSFDQRIFATEYSDHRDAWYMIVQSRKTGKTLVIFNPDQDFIDAVKKFIPRQLKFEKFGRN